MAKFIHKATWYLLLIGISIKSGEGHSVESCSNVTEKYVKLGDYDSCETAAGFSVAFNSETVSANEAEESCANLSAETGKTWKLPNPSELLSSDFLSIRLAINNIVPGPALTYVWMSNEPAIGILKNPPEGFQKKVVAIPFKSSSIQTFEQFVIDGKAVNTARFACVRRLALDEITFLGNKLFDFQAKVRVKKLGSSLKAIDNLSIYGKTITTQTSSNFFKTYFKSDEKSFGAFSVVDSNRSILVHVYGLSPGTPASIVIEVNDAEKSFERELAIASAEVREMLEDAASSESLVHITGTMDLFSFNGFNFRTGPLKVKSANLVPHSGSYFSHCVVETKHFRSTQYGCLYFPDPAVDAGYALFGSYVTRPEFWHQTDKFPVSLAQSVFVQPELRHKAGLPVFFNYTPSELDGLTKEEEAYFSERKRATPVCGPGTANLPSFCSPTVEGYAGFQKLANGETIDEFFAKNPLTIDLELLPIWGQKSLNDPETGYTRHFPNTEFPKDFKFSPFLEQDFNLLDANAYCEWSFTQVGPTSSCITPAKYPYNFLKMNFDFVGSTQTFRPKTGGGGLFSLRTEIRHIVYLLTDKNIRENDTSIEYRRQRLMYPDVAQNITIEDKVTMKPEKARIKKVTHTINPEKPTNVYAIFNDPMTNIRQNSDDPFNKSRAGFVKCTVPNCDIVQYSDFVPLSYKSSLIPAIPIDRMTSKQSCSRIKSNRTNNFDVDSNGVVNPLDALIVLNLIGRARSGQINCNPYFLDVNNDGQVTPLDALLVLNHLREKNAGN